MAKPNRESVTPLPLSAGFYALLARVGRRHRLDLENTAALAEAVAALSHAYTRERSTLHDEARGAGALLARLGFFLPRDLAKVWGPLSELARARPPLFARPLRVLDVGAGLGTTSLGLAHYLARSGARARPIDVHAVERDAAALALCADIAKGLPALGDEFAPLTLHAHAEDAAAELPKGPFDLITCGLVLNELGDAATRLAEQSALVARLVERLAPDGALIVLEPALKASARGLMALRDHVLGAHPDLAVIAPCVHRAPCPMLANERDFCHESVPFALPAPLAGVARAAGLRFEGLSYAALVLARGGDAAPDVPLGHVRYRVVSDPLPSKGKHELYGCGRTGYVRLSMLDRERGQARAPFEAARRGDGLLLGNEDARVAGTDAVALSVGPRGVVA